MKKPHKEFVARQLRELLEDIDEVRRGLNACRYSLNEFVVRIKNQEKRLDTAKDHLDAILLGLHFIASQLIKEIRYTTDVLDKIDNHLESKIAELKRRIAFMEK